MLHAGRCMLTGIHIDRCMLAGDRCMVSCMSGGAANSIIVASQ